jgi:hypothetical protein
MFSVSVIQQARSRACNTTDGSSFSSGSQSAYCGSASGANANALSGFHAPPVFDVLVIRSIMCDRRDRLNGCN